MDFQGDYSFRVAIHMLDAGHFALDTKANEIAALIEEFLKRQQ